ncbi:hypothetical protein SEVIR_7G020552v4 [Setaria viridis]
MQTGTHKSHNPLLHSNVQSQQQKKRLPVTSNNLTPFLIIFYIKFPLNNSFKCEDTEGNPSTWVTFCTAPLKQTEGKIGDADEWTSDVQNKESFSLQIPDFVVVAGTRLDINKLSLACCDNNERVWIDLVLCK